MLVCKLTQVLVCQHCLLSATTDDSGSTSKNVFVICFLCKQQKFDPENGQKQAKIF